MLSIDGPSNYFLCLGDYILLVILNNVAQKFLCSYIKKSQEPIFMAKTSKSMSLKSKVLRAKKAKSSPLDKKAKALHAV